MLSFSSRQPDFQSFPFTEDGMKFLRTTGYIRHVAGTKTFNYAFFVGSSFLFGEAKTKEPDPNGSTLVRAASPAKTH